MNLKPPAGDAPVSVGIGGRTYTDNKNGVWRIDNPADAEDLIRAGWTVANNATAAPVAAPAAPPEGA